MNIPQGYKQTELGIIPEEWTICKICDGLADVKCGKRLPLGYYVTENRTAHPYIRVIDMYDGGVDTSNILYVPEDAYPAIEKYRIFKNDIFISVAGSLGIVGKIPEKLDGANLTENANKLTNISCNRDYLLHFLRSPYIQRVISSEQTIGAQPKLALTRIRNFEIILPDTEQEQNVIAEALSDVDALITALDKKTAKKRLIKQGAMQQLLTGKMRLTGFDIPWEIALMKEWVEAGAISLYRGKVISKKDIEANPGDYPIYSSSVTNNGYMGSYGAYAFDRELISWSVDGGGNFFYRWKHKFSLTNVCGYMFLDEAMFDYRYLTYQLSFLHSKENFDYLSKAHPSVISRIYRIARPDMAEQQSIARVLSDMDKEIADLEARRDKYKLIKSGMMQKLLTGQIRLTKPQCSKH